MLSLHTIIANIAISRDLALATIAALPISNVLSYSYDLIVIFHVVIISSTFSTVCFPPAAQLEDTLEREKKHRSDVEKAKRKVENDLKMTQENVEELERIRHDLEETLRRSVSACMGCCAVHSIQRNCDILNK